VIPPRSAVWTLLRSRAKTARVLEPTIASVIGTTKVWLAIVPVTASESAPAAAPVNRYPMKRSSRSSVPLTLM